jgi:hypothetical protein
MSHLRPPAAFLNLAFGVYAAGVVNLLTSLVIGGIRLERALSFQIATGSLSLACAGLAYLAIVAADAETKAMPTLQLSLKEYDAQVVTFLKRRGPQRLVAMVMVFVGTIVAIGEIAGFLSSFLDFASGWLIKR